MAESASAYLNTIGGYTIPSTFSGSGPQGSMNAQDLNYAYGDPLQDYIGKKAGIAEERFAFAGALPRASAAAILALLAGTTPFAIQFAKAGSASAATGWKLAGALCESFQCQVTENATAVSISGVARAWSAVVAPTSVAALTPLPSDVLDGIAMGTATLLAGDHAKTLDASFGMQRTFKSAGRDPVTGYATIHDIQRTIFTATAAIPLGDGVDEMSAYSALCITDGTVVLALGVTCLPTGDTGVAAVHATMTHMGYVDRPRPDAINGVAALRVTATSATGTSALTAA